MSKNTDQINKKKPNYGLIQSAINGHSDAIEDIIQIYQPYIYIKGKTLNYDFYNNPFEGIDPELKHRIEQKLRAAIPKFKDDYKK